MSEKRIPINYRINIANGFRVPTGHMSITSRGSDNEFKNLRNLGAIGDSVPDMQKDYFETLGQNGSLDDLFGNMEGYLTDPDFKVTYIPRELYESGFLPSLKQLFTPHICDIEFSNPMRIKTSSFHRLQDRDQIEFGEVSVLPELSFQKFFVKKINNTVLELYDDIYFKSPFNGSTINSTNFVATCSFGDAIPAGGGNTNVPATDYPNMKLGGGRGCVTNVTFDLDGNITSFEPCSDLPLVETDGYTGGKIPQTNSDGSVPLVTPDTPFPPTVNGEEDNTGDTSGSYDLPDTLDVSGTNVELLDTVPTPAPSNVDDPVVVKGTETNPAPVGESYELILPELVVEDEAFEIRLVTTGVSEGTEFDVILSGVGVNTNDFEVGNLQEKFVIDANGIAVLNYKTLADLTTEGDESVDVKVVGLPLEGIIEISDTSITPPPSVTVVPIQSPVTETQLIEFDISIVSYPVGTVFNYTIYGDIDANDIEGSLTGSVTYEGVSPIRVSRQVVEDFTTEGNETVFLTIQGLESDPDATGSIVITDTSQDPTYSLSSNVTQTYEENKTITLTLNTTDVPDNTVFNYQVTGIQSEDVTGDPLSGSMTIVGGTASITFTTVPDATTEGDETLIFTLPELSLSANVNIIDSSQDPILVDVNIQIDFTADEWDGVNPNDFLEPAFFEKSSYGRPLFMHGGVTKQTDTYGSYFDVPLREAIYWENGNGPQTTGANNPNPQPLDMYDFQMHLVIRPVRSTVNDDTLYMMWGYRADNLNTYYGERIDPNSVDMWADRVLYTGHSSETYVDEKIQVLSIIHDKTNGGDFIRYVNGVETGRIVTTGSGQNQVISLGQLILGHKFIDTSRVDSFAIDLYEAHLYTGNDFTYFTNKHNELRTKYGI